MNPLRLLAVAAALSIAAPLAAQTPAPTGTRTDSIAGPRNFAAFLLARSDALSLTDDQTARLTEIVRETGQRLEELRSELRAARPDAPLDADARAEFRERRRDARDATIDAFGEARTAAIAVLTPEQQSEALEMLARRVESGRMMAQRPRMPRRPMRGRPDRGRPGNRPPRPDAPPPPPAPQR